MTARVAGVSAAATSATPGDSVAGSMSTKTGVAPSRTTQFATEGQVKVGRMTSSPGRKSSAISARCTAAVPLEQATTSPPRKAAASASVSATILP